MSATCPLVLPLPLLPLLPMLSRRLLLSPTLGPLGKPPPKQLVVFLDSRGLSLSYFEQPTLLLHPPCSQRRRNLLPLLQCCRLDRPDHLDLSYHFSPQHCQFIELPTLQLQHWSIRENKLLKPSSIRGGGGAIDLCCDEAEEAQLPAISTVWDCTYIKVVPPLVFVLVPSVCRFSRHVPAPTPHHDRSMVKSSY